MPMVIAECRPASACGKTAGWLGMTVKQLEANYGQ